MSLAKPSQVNTVTNLSTAGTAFKGHLTFGGRVFSKCVFLLIYQRLSMSPASHGLDKFTTKA
jgi:hypothetical protein